MVRVFSLLLSRGEVLRSLLAVDNSNPFYHLLDGLGYGQNFQTRSNTRALVVIESEPCQKSGRRSSVQAATSSRDASVHSEDAKITTSYQII